MRNGLKSIQVLRAIAATAVVFAHAKGHLLGFNEKYGIGDAWLNTVDTFNTGQCGVDIFFVISGFIMAMVTSEAHQQQGAVKTFAGKRLIRIFPPYWFWTFIILSLLLFSPQLFSVRTFEVKEAILSLLLVPYVPSGANTSPVLAVGWTLSYEMYFYALVCIGLLFSRKVFIVGIGVFFLITTVIFPQNYGPISNLTRNMILWEFYAGVLLFEFFITGKQLSIPFSIILIFSAIFAFYYFAEEGDSPLRFVYWGIPAVALVAAFISLERETGTHFPKTAIMIGDSSYTLYLSHLITLPAIAKVFVVLGAHKVLPPDLQIILYTIICILVGYILYILTEKPILNYFRKGKPIKVEPISSHP